MTDRYAVAPVRAAVHSQAVGDRLRPSRAQCEAQSSINWIAGRNGILGGSCSRWISARSGRRTSGSRRSTARGLRGRPGRLPGRRAGRAGFDIYKDKEHFRLVGQVQTTLELPCSRCLEPFTGRSTPTFDLRYQPRTREHRRRRARNRRRRPYDGVLREREIDLGQLMREQFYLVAADEAALCRDDCHGLCSVVRNESEPRDMHCKPAWEDPGWRH